MANSPLSKVTPDMSSAKSPESATNVEIQRGRPLGVYVHFPWCLSKCPYCDFFSVASHDAIPHVAYADAVIAEFDARCHAIDAAQIRSLYFGGGTPSLWDPDAVARVVGHVVNAAGKVRNDLEITLECNPSSFEIERCQRWKAAGVNRLSLGLQSLNSKNLEFLGRRHNAREAMAALEHALASGIPSVGADLIFGLPGQQPKDALDELNQLPLSVLDHLSVYALTIESNTPFGAQARAGRLPLAQDDDVVATFVALHETLVASQFEHYEISNYARSGCRAVHNTGYWKGEDYLGLGVAAWGTVHRELTAGSGTCDRLRYRNTQRITNYLGRCLGADSNVFWTAQPAGILSESEPIDGPTALTERLMLGLRMSDGVDLSELSREFDVDGWFLRHQRSIEKLSERGRLVREGSVLRIPFEAWFLADGTISELI